MNTIKTLSKFNNQGFFPVNTRMNRIVILTHKKRMELRLIKILIMLTSQVYEDFFAVTYARMINCYFKI